MTDEHQTATEHSEGMWSRKNIGEGLLMALALTVPWGVIEVALQPQAQLGNFLGCTVGMFCFWMVKPRNMSTTRVVVLYLFVLLVTSLLK
jgi:hypothetical protein